MNKMQTLDAFWNGFDLPAYDENSVPDDITLPYITYEAMDNDFGQPIALTASLWYRDSGWSAITAKEQEISDYITRGGRMLAYDGGAIWLQKQTPWAQRMQDSNDEMIRRIVLNISVEFLD